MQEKTLSIIKPDAVKDKVAGKIITQIEDAGFDIISIQKVLLSKEQAKEFYIVHKERPFYEELVDFMVSGPVIVQVLEKENAIEDYRKLMGATNPEEAENGTIRKIFGKSIDSNAVHGSDSPENAEIEINFFFNTSKLIELKT